MRIPKAATFFGLVLFATTIWVLVLISAQADDPTSARMPVLAVSVSNDGEEGIGGVAYLNLRIVNGTGNVYIHSDPLTKIDTQASTTYAQRYACSIAQVDCDRYDFLYSIESNAPIIGGPSAGGAAAALTYAVLTGQRVPRDVAVTGTISSGGVIGTVGGIPQKIEAAELAGIRSVIIPNLSNASLENATITVIRASTLPDVITGLGLEGPRTNGGSISVPDTYRETMRNVAEDLCAPQEVPLLEIRSDTIEASYSRIENLTGNASLAGSIGDYYTQASHCFNIRVQRYYLQLIEETTDLNDTDASGYAAQVLSSELEQASEVFEDFRTALEDPDLNDIQIYSIVEERYQESRTIGEAIIEEMDREAVSSAFRSRFDENTLFSAAYVLARIDSMESWMRFSGFEQGSPISERALRNACTKKLSAATEISEYTSYLTGANVLDTSRIYEAYEKREFASCIYQASLLTARAEAFLSTIGVTDESLPELYEAKSRAAYHAIAEQTAKGHFPVMAYSYYEYAQSLKETNRETALLYIENALSLAELDLYLENASLGVIRFERDTQLAFALGVFVMAGIGLIITAGSTTRTRPKKGRLRRIGTKRKGNFPPGPNGP